MAQANDNAPATGLFPQYGPDMYAMVASEVEGLTDEQLDWESDRWEWSKWSIRRQVSHMPSFVKGWLLQRWGGQLFPGGTSHLGEMAEYDRSPGGSWLNEDRFWDLPVLLEQWSSSIDLALPRTGGGDGGVHEEETGHRPRRLGVLEAGGARARYRGQLPPHGRRSHSPDP